MHGSVVSVAGCALLLVACGGQPTSAPLPEETTTAPVSVTASPSDGETPAPASPSGDADVVHLLYISDSSGWETGDAYAALAQEELGVPVELVDWRYGGLSMIGVPDDIERRRDVVADAEIVVLWANPVGSGVKPGESQCIDDEFRDGEVEVFSEDDWRPFSDLTGQVLDSIWEARGGQPTVMRVTDLYVPVVKEWRDEGIFDVCMGNFEAMSAAMRRAAEEHGATFVSSLDMYNGPDHMADPVAVGYIREDGMHPSLAGAQAMAEALAAAGFEPNQAP